MSDSIKHECGIVLIRLLKPLSYYQEKYGTVLYGLNKLYLLLEKQHNRGQDGAGVASVKLDIGPGQPYLHRYRSNAKQPIADIFESINQSIYEVCEQAQHNNFSAEWMKSKVPFLGEVMLGHLRYGTFGGNTIDQCHPFIRSNNWMTRNLVIAGNFNMTNVEEVYQMLVELGQHPKEKSDTVTVLENIGHFVDEENDRLYQMCKEKGMSKRESSSYISNHIDVTEVLKRASKKWDGGYVIAGLLGHGDSFVFRDPAGIRPAFYYYDDEICIVASERPAIQTALNIDYSIVKELTPGHALVIKKDGSINEHLVNKPVEKRSCSFERIYFSRGSDRDIYRERKELGRLLCPAVFDSIGYDLKNTVFSFIPNTAETAFYGMVSGVEDYLKEVKKRKILEGGTNLTHDKLSDILDIKPRIEKIAIKDAKMRTFITNDKHRDEMVTHVYDITYGTIRKKIDNLVIIDDSIVRGTTLRNSILRMLDRLEPKKIVVVSSAPQIRFPDCYGIDMAKIGDLVAFQAAISLLEKHNKEHIIDQVYALCKDQLEGKVDMATNYVNKIYEPFDYKEVSSEITRLLKATDINAEVEIIFQSIENLHNACPGHTGDWYFSGQYPTPGGNRVVSRAFINYVEGINERAY
ncbi:MAG TPA: amidophosphoribosyltransferase [Bacteroidia bacterium]|nr:amidophosphoribosyltransferase [Bacteroidia bacterium]HNT79842.1 amidophosphoribosyltransferase [Bacteroidia bacterium]